MQLLDTSEMSSSEKRQRFVAAPPEEYPDIEGTPKSRSEVAHREEAILCSRCPNIDVEHLFIKLKVRKPRQKFMNLGKLGPETELSPCLLCRLFYAVKIQNDEDLEDYDYVLYSTHPPLPWVCDARSVLAVVRGASKCRQEASWARVVQNGRLSRFIASSIAPGSNPHIASLRARSIDAISLDFDVIRGWMRLCIGKHAKQCVQATSSTSDLKDLKLIDCEQRRIIQALSSTKYSALSYIWCTNGFGNNDWSIHNKLPTTLPQTIEDALKVTKELGLRYIWIDRYCINQDDGAEKQIQIRQMDLMYENAFITITAAAGTDPYFGLPGVGTSRNVQQTAWIKGTCLVSILPDPRNVIRTSK